MSSGIDAKNIIVNLSVTGNYAAGMARAGAATQTFGNQANAGMAKAQSGMAKWGAVASKVGKYSALVMAAALVLSAKAAIDFETGFAGVRKTIEASEPVFQRLSDGFRELATEIPISVKELLKIGELGGQLGVDASGLIEFTDTIAKIGVTTTLSTEDAALGFARLDNIMGLNEGSFDRIGSTIVDLGNNFAATEDEILRFSLRVAPVGGVIGLTTDEVLALATAFTSVGIPAERGGTAVQKSFVKMADAVDIGGEKLAIFATTAGMASDEFASLFRRDPAEAFSAFVTGLGEVANSGGSAFAVLRSIGLADQRVMGALLGMANASDTLTDALDRGEQAWDDNTALAIEAEKRFGTVASQLITLKNKIGDLSIGLGLVLLPLISDLITGFGVVFDWANAIPAKLKAVVAMFTALSAAIFLLTKHPVILGLMAIAAVVTQIGANARESAERVQILRDAIESSSQLTRADLEELIGGNEVKGLLDVGFTPAEIDEAVRGTKEDYFEFAKKLRAAVGGTEPFVFSNLYEAGFNESLVTDSDAFNAALAKITRARRSFVTAVTDIDELNRNRNRAAIFGLPFPGDDERIAQMERGREAVQSLYRARQQLGRLGQQEAEPITPAFISDKSFDAIGTALTDYSTIVDEAFSEVDSAVRDQIDLWYEFDDELNVAFDDIIETLTRQISAIGDFENVLGGLGLRADVETFIRDAFNTPALMEAFNTFAETGGRSFNEWLNDLETQANRVIELVRMKWESLNKPIEFKTGQQFLADIKAAADLMINDPNNTYDPAAVWLGIIQSTIDSARPDLRSKLLDLLSDAFADDGTLSNNVDLITEQLDILRLYLLGLEDDYNINVITTFTQEGSPSPLPNTSQPLEGTDFPASTGSGGSGSSGGGGGSGGSGVLEFAHGGNAFANRPYIVGELGPELFVPFNSGTVIPNNQLNNAPPSNNISVTFNVEKGTAVADIQTGLVLSGVAELVDLSRAG